MRHALDLSLSSRAWATPQGVSYSAEAEALFARFTTPPTDARKVLINATIVDLKDAGLWVKSDALYLKAAHDAQAARRNWIADQYNLTAVNSPIFTADRGYAGNGSSSYLRTGFNPTTAVSPKFVQNSCHISLMDRTSRAAANRVEMGAINGGPTIFSAEIATRFTGNLALMRICDAVASTTSTANALSDGSFLVSRTGSTTIDKYRNGASIEAATTTSAAPTNHEFYIGCLNNNGTASLYSTDQIAFASIGAGLTAQEAADLYTIVNTYLIAVGAA